MQLAILSLFVLGAAVVVVGAVIAAFALRAAPEGFEDETGFHAVRVRADSDVGCFRRSAIGSGEKQLELAA